MWPLKHWSGELVIQTVLMLKGQTAIRGARPRKVGEQALSTCSDRWWWPLQTSADLFLSPLALCLTTQDWSSDSPCECCWLIPGHVCVLQNHKENQPLPSIFTGSGQTWWQEEVAHRVRSAAESSVSLKLSTFLGSTHRQRLSTYPALSHFSLIHRRNVLKRSLTWQCSWKVSSFMSVSNIFSLFKPAADVFQLSWCCLCTNVQLKPKTNWWLISAWLRCSAAQFYMEPKCPNVFGSTAEWNKVFKPRIGFTLTVTQRD